MWWYQPNCFWLGPEDERCHRLAHDGFCAHHFAQQDYRLMRCMRKRYHRLKRQLFNRFMSIYELNDLRIPTGDLATRKLWVPWREEGLPSSRLDFRYN